MQNVNLSTKNQDLKVVFGPVYKSKVPIPGRVFDEDPKDSDYDSVRYILNDLNNIRDNYIKLGFHLDECQRNKCYYRFLYSNFEDFCLANFNLDKSAVSRCINVYREFNASNDVKYKNGVKTKGAAIEVAEDWKDYSYTQLTEILPLMPEQRKAISPDMTIKEIREYKKSLKGNKTSTVASTQPEFIPFDINRYDNTYSKEVKAELIKKSSAIDENAIFYIYDKNGKFFDGNVWCDLLYAKGGRYFFRLTRADNRE